VRQRRRRRAVTRCCAYQLFDFALFHRRRPRYPQVAHAMAAPEPPFGGKLCAQVRALFSLLAMRLWAHRDCSPG
jgi:hypothetical protein